MLAGASTSRAFRLRPACSLKPNSGIEFKPASDDWHACLTQSCILHAYGCEGDVSPWDLVRYSV